MALYRMVGGVRKRIPILPGTRGVPVVPDREGLVVGVDKPGPDNTGPYTVTSFTDVYPPNGSIDLPVSGLQVGKRYWGCVKPADGAVFRECIFAGPDPLRYGAGNQFGGPPQKGAFQNFGSNPGKVEVWDSVIDMGLWLTSAAPGGARPAGNPHGFGVHGGNIKMYRTEIRNCGDGWNFVGPNGSIKAAELGQATLMQQCWLHKGFYANDVRSITDGQNHSDGFQFNFGRNVTIRGNTIGGQRSSTGYLTWPGGFNAGDDFAYSCIMMTQESPPSSDSILTNILIEKNWLSGGTATINMPIERGNDASGTTIQYNRFARRGSDWGATKTANANTNPAWVPYQNNSGPGYYIISQAGNNGHFEGNVYDDTGLPISTPN